MILFEFAWHLINFDIVWLFDFFTGNLLMVFAVSALVYFFWDGKYFFEAFIIFFLLMWSWDIFGGVSGLVIFGASFLMVLYTSKLILLVIAENTPSLKNKLVIVSSLGAYTLLILFKLFGG